VIGVKRMKTLNFFLQTLNLNSNWYGKKPNPLTSLGTCGIYNIGNNQLVELMSFLNTLEKVLGKKAKTNLNPLQDGGIPSTFANIDNLKQKFYFSPKTFLEFGIREFVNCFGGDFMESDLKIYMNSTAFSNYQTFSILYL